MNHGIDEKNHQEVLFHVTEIMECGAAEDWGDRTVDKGVGNGRCVLIGIEVSGQRQITSFGQWLLEA